MRHTIFIVFILLFYILSLSCTATGPNDGLSFPGDPEMRVEYDFMPGYDASDDDFDYFNLLHAAFVDIGYNPSWMRDDDHELPANGYNGDPFPVDDRSLRSYSRTHFDHTADFTLRRWHLLCVHQTAATDGRLGQAAELNNGVNSPPSPVIERFSMIFLADIRDAYPSFSERYSVTIRTTVHELGHQRAGLTHVQTSSEFHQSIAPNYCVMDNLGVFNTPRFCVDFPSADGDDFNSCYDNLLRNRTVD